MLTSNNVEQTKIAVIKDFLKNSLRICINETVLLKKSLKRIRINQLH